MSADVPDPGPANGAAQLRVWAPNAGRVEAVIERDGRRLPMHGEGRGWWSTAESVAAGTDYRFSLDGDVPLPDPRSPSQPAGVHGPSRTVDHAAFTWHDDEWHPEPFANAVLYELHVGTFTAEGTFDAAIERLDHVAALGVTHVELMPVAEFPGDRGWGYDVADFYAPHHAYGGPDGLRRFVDAAHVRGLAVLLDVVYNHFGPDGVYLARFGPYLTDRYRTTWGEAVNLDGPGSDEVRRFLVDNALMWLRDYHVDGLRLDAVHTLFDESAVHVLEELAREVDELERALGRSLVLVAESDLNAPRFVRPPAEGGFGLDAQWNDDFRHALHVTLTGERHGIHGDFAGLPDLARALEEVFVYTGQYSRFRDRRHGRPPLGLDGTRFVGFLLNHDQAGNRPLGERSSALLSADALRVAAAIVLTAPFVPLLFAGEEFAASSPFLYFTDHVDPQVAAAVRAGRRSEFPHLLRPGLEVPDPQAPRTFERSKLDWSEAEREPGASMLEWHRRLIEARRRLPELRDGRLATTARGASGRWLVVERGGLRLVVNLADHEQRVPLRGAGLLALLLASRSDGARLGAADVTLGPMSAVLVGPAAALESMEGGAGR